MLINLRNALMSGKRLPYDAEVEYLESTGPQYVDLGLNSTTDRFYNFEISFALTFATSSIPFGYAYGGTARYGLWNTVTNWLVGANYSNSIDLGAKDTDWHHVLTHFGTSVEVDGSTLAIGGGSVRANIGLNLFARVTSASGATSRILSSAKISMFRIWDTGGNLLRDMIPVRKGTVGYLYDRVSGKLFGNAGTGDFVLGPDVVPVEYIESHGTEWMDTGIAHDQTFRWECDAEFTSIGTVNRYIGQTYETAQGGGAPRFAFGAGGGGAWYAGLGNVNATGLATADTDRHVFVLDAPQKTFRIDDNAYTVNWSSFSLPTYVGCGLGLFGRSYLDTDGKVNPFCLMRIYSSKHYQNGVLVRKYLPVRVGTDATSWEGAMMDVLTRRIYRNAGTGAFGYGNDLKYPIPAE